MCLGIAVAGSELPTELIGRHGLERRLGTPNACSCLYRAAWRVAREMGYERLVTYILATEPGTSLRAAGWTYVREAGGGSWSVSSRPRHDKHPTEKRVRWEVGRTARPNEGRCRHDRRDELVGQAQPAVMTLPAG